MDLTLREETLDQLLSSQALLGMVCQAARIGVWSLPCPFLEFEWSDEVFTIFGLPTGPQPTLKRMIDSCAAEFRPRIQGYLDLCATDGVPFDQEWPIVSGVDQQRVWIRGMGKAQYDSSGKVARVMGIFQNVDGQRAMANDLRQAQKMATIGHLAGGMAHDFNNILSVILGYTEFILDDLTAEDPLREDLQEVRRAGLRGSVLARQLRAFSRPPAMQPQVIEVGQVVEDLGGMLGRLLGSSIELALITGFASGRVWADPSEIELILLNLVISARDSMPTGGKLSIETVDVNLDSEYCASYPGVAPGAYVMLAITDTGAGSDGEASDRLRQPLGTMESCDATGLVQATIFSILQTLKGHARVDSEPGRGSSVKICIPCVDGSSTSDTLERPSPEGSRGFETILLVEDNDPFRTVTGAILRRQGYHVLEAQNGAEASLICEQLTSPLHLLIADIVMPRVSGYALTENLRTMLPQLPALLITAAQDAPRVFDPTGDSTIPCLLKPFSPDTLLVKVREVLDGGNGAETNEAVAP